MRAEKAAALASAKTKERASAKRKAVEKSVTEDAPQAKNAPAKEVLAKNVDVVDVPGIGKREAGVVDEVVYIIGKAETSKTLGEEMMRREADGVFYVLQVAAHNTSKETHDVTTALMKLVDDQGREFDPSSEGSLALSMAGEQSAEAFSAQTRSSPWFMMHLRMRLDSSCTSRRAALGSGKASISRCRPRASRAAQR